MLHGRTHGRSLHTSPTHLRQHTSPQPSQDQPGLPTTTSQQPAKRAGDPAVAAVATAGAPADPAAAAVAAATTAADMGAVSSAERTELCWYKQRQETSDAETVI